MFIPCLKHAKPSKQEPEIFVWGPICVANLLVYTNFYIHTQTHVFIHAQKISIFHNESLKLNVS